MKQIKRTLQYHSGHEEECGEFDQLVKGDLCG